MRVPSADWVAGFFEGEGTVCLASAGAGRQRRLVVEITNTDPEPLEAIQRFWKGRVYRYEGRGEQRPFWRWAAASREAAAFLRAIEPSVMRSTVRERVAIALEFQDLRRSDWSNRSAAYKQRDRELAEKLGSLNQRGREPLERAVLGARQ